MTQLFALLAACIFALELYANLRNSEGIIAWLHLLVIGCMEVFLIGYLIVSSVTYMWSRVQSDRRRGGIRA